MSNIDLGNSPVGTPPTSGEQLQIRTAIGAASQSSVDTKITVFNPRNYGAVGNGVADDTVAFQNCVAAAKAVFGEIYIPHGTYKVTGTALKLDWEGATVRGQGQSNFGQRSLITTTVRKPIVDVPADYNGIKLEGFALTGPSGSFGSAVTYTADTATDILTATAHGLQTGDMFMVANSGGTYPAPLRRGKVYFAIRLTDNTLKVADNSVNAAAGTGINITGAGSGTNTILPTTCGIVYCGDSGGGASIDYSTIDAVNTRTFSVGMYLEEFSNCSMRASGSEGCYIGAIIGGNSMTISATPFNAASGAGSVGLWLSGGVGSVVSGCDFPGTMEVGLLHEGSTNTTVIGCNFETAGSRSVKSVSTDGRSLRLISCGFNHHGAQTSDTYSLEMGEESVIAIGCSFTVVTSTTGAAVKQNNGASRSFVAIGFPPRIDMFTAGSFVATLRSSGSGIGTQFQNSGEPASELNHGTQWRRVFSGGNDVHYVSVRNAAGTYSLADLYKYHFDTATNGQPAWASGINTFTGAVNIFSAAANPHIRILTGADGGASTRYSIGISTQTNGLITGSASGDTILGAKSGGRLLIGTSTTGNTQEASLAVEQDGGITAVRGYFAGTEQTAPAAPASNGYRIYAEDNGSGKTRLMVKFATGAAQQIAIEP